MNIKFRAWDKVSLKIKTVTCLDFADWWVSTGYKEGERNSFKNEETDRHILMQYTGLKDKNGKEIYEGDIVIQTPMLVSNLESITGVVTFSEGAYWIDNNKDARKLFTEADTNEILGNIYKHPGLLNGDECKDNRLWCYGLNRNGRFYGNEVYGLEERWEAVEKGKELAKYEGLEHFYIGRVGKNDNVEDIEKIGVENNEN